MDKKSSKVLEYNKIIDLLAEKASSSLGLKYIGPIDGNDIPTLIKYFTYAKNNSETTVVHIKTTKGFYMDNKAFSASEIETVKSAILSTGGVSDEEKETLAARVVDALTKRYSK